MPTSDSAIRPMPAPIAAPRAPCARSASWCCRLLTNNPDKCIGLASHGIDVVERVPLLIEPNPDNARYLRSKQDRLGHLLGLA